LISAKSSSIGFMSGEYGASFRSLTPASAHICSSLSEREWRHCP
jgi:hypothetical protein